METVRVMVVTQSLFTLFSVSSRVYVIVWMCVLGTAGGGRASKLASHPVTSPSYTGLV